MFGILLSKRKRRMLEMQRENAGVKGNPMFGWKKTKRPPPELVKLAKEYPNGWMYEVLPEFKGKSDVPMEGIVGAWKVDDKGNIVGGFIPMEDFGKH